MADLLVDGTSLATSIVLVCDDGRMRLDRATMQSAAWHVEPRLVGLGSIDSDCFGRTWAWSHSTLMSRADIEGHCPLVHHIRTKGS
jgi:hypothetical protein